MAVAAPAADFAKLLFRTAPFSKMEAARRFQLLSQARSVKFLKGERILSEDTAPVDVCMVLAGKVTVHAQMPGEEAPVLLEECGAGACVGWFAALSGIRGISAVAVEEVQGLIVAAPAFLEITRYDPALREAIFRVAGKGEVWRAVHCELRRRGNPLANPRAITESILPECVVRDWPEEESEIIEDTGKIWIVSGGEGIEPGARWNGGDGVLWARLVGLPVQPFGKAIAESIPQAKPQQKAAALLEPKKESLRAVPLVSPHVLAPRKTTSRFAKVEQPRRTTGSFMKAVATVLFLAIAVVCGAAFWASQQQVRETLSVRGKLIFTGEIRPLTSSVSGVLSQHYIRVGERFERGAMLAVVRPPLDEAKLQLHNDAAQRALLQAAYCDAIIAGQNASPSQIPASLTDLSREYARLRGELRIFSAIQQGNANVPGLSATESKRVAAHLATVRASYDEQLDMRTRDAGTRQEDLRDAEIALREAQEEMRAHQQNEGSISAEKNDEAKRERTDYNRLLALHKRTVAQRQELVTRVRKEVAILQPAAAAAPPAPEVSTELTRLHTALQAVEQRFIEAAAALRNDAAAQQTAMAAIRSAATPREIRAAQAGQIIDAAKLDIGAAVEPGTVLGRIKTRSSWQIACDFSASQSARLSPGQPVSYSISNEDGTTTRLAEQLIFSGADLSRLLIKAGRDDWSDGQEVQVETSVVKGTLLDEWLAKAGMK